MKGDRTVGLLLWSTTGVILIVSSILAFVPLVYPPPPPWPVFCETGECPEKITVLELGRRKLLGMPWVRKILN